ncbi:MAG: carbon monoxide dehydrogenase subunit G [Rhizomicrobium sp.]|jgi:carbon monoxide dehydrogenase subunit G
MDFSGRYSIPATPEVVWASLNDPDVLKSCIPGCESLARTDATHLTATAVLKIGPVKATFSAKIEQAEMAPPSRCVLRGEGQGGVAGFARGEAEVSLVPDEGGTVLTYSARASVGGKLAQIGQRLIDGAARHLADEFFLRFAARVMVAQDAGTQVEAPPAEPVPAEITLSAAGPNREGLAPEVWVVGLIGVIAVLLVIFGLTLRPS